jgi:outer membrane protein
MFPRDRCRWLVSVFLGVLICGAVPQPARGQNAGGEPALLTLQDCVRIALDSSVNLRIREAEVEIGGRNVKEAWGAFLPNLSLTGTYNKSDRTDYDITSSIFGTQLVGFETVMGDSVFIPAQVVVGSSTSDVNVKATTKSWGAAANLTLFDGLANVNRLRSARARERAAVYGQESTRETVIERVAVAYYDLLRFQRLREVAAETRDQAAAELQRTDTYFRLGSAAKSDVLQQRVRLEQTRFDLVVAENRVENAVANLAYAMNQPLTRRLSVDTTPLTTSLEGVDITALGGVQILAERYDLQSAAAELEAASRGAAAAGGAVLPRLDLYTRYQRSYDESPYRFGSQESQSWLWGAQVSWDIFSRFQISSNRARTRAQARIAEYQYEQAELDAQLEVRQYWISLSEAIERHRVALETITLAKEELRLAQERFRVGAGTQLERITAEVNLAAARAEEVQAVCDYLIARTRLWRAIGKLDELGLG